VASHGRSKVVRNDVHWVDASNRSLIRENVCLDRGNLCLTRLECARDNAAPNRALVAVCLDDGNALSGRIRWHGAETTINTVRVHNWSCTGDSGIKSGR